MIILRESFWTQPCSCLLKSSISFLQCIKVKGQLVSGGTGTEHSAVVPFRVVVSPVVGGFK